VRGHQILLIVGCVKSLFTIAVEAVAYSVTRPLHFYRGYRTLLNALMLSNTSLETLKGKPMSQVVPS
jgi:hypothetical protein